MIKPAYSVSFLLSINIFVWQNVLYFLDAARILQDDTRSRQYQVEEGVCSTLNVEAKSDINVEI